jgi:predicted DNA-binding transcriptional regulator AlpA
VGRVVSPDWPRMMRRATAAAYCDMTGSEFEREVAAGRLPCPAVVGGSERWSRSQIDEALERLTGEGVPDWRAGQPLYRAENQ